MRLLQRIPSLGMAFTTPASRTIRPHAKARSGAMALRSIQAYFVVALLHLQSQWV